MATDAAKVTDYGKWLGAQYGLAVTSQTRTPERNRAVGGAPNSDHLTGLALDLAGDPAKMAALAEWARANMGPGKMFRWVGWGDSGHQDHVHLSFNADATVPTVDAQATAQEATVTTAPATAPASTRPDITHDTPPEEIEEYLRTYYPDVAPFLGDPAIKMLLYAAAIDDWDDRKLEAAIRQTTYWKTHSPNARKLDALLASDRNAAVQVIEAGKGIVSDLFTSNGLNLDGAKVGQLAKDAIKAGFIGFNDDGSVYVANAGGLNDMLAFGLNARPQGEDLARDIGFSAEALMQMARGEYLLPITRREAENYAVKILQGQATEDAFRQEMNARARDRYGWLGLGEGQTTASRFDGHVATIAQYLEVDPDTVDLLDPRWNRIVEFNDGNTTRSMGLGETARLARGMAMEMPAAERPQWAREADAEISTNLLRFIGRVA